MEPLKYLLKTNVEKNIALLVLNCPFEVIEKKLGILWERAVTQIVVDGAANHVHTLVQKNKTFMPDFITGDFDSVKKEVLEYFKREGTEIVHTPDQDHTDFTKALQFLLTKQNLEYGDIVVLGGIMDSRVDQMFGNLKTLYSASKMTDKKVVLIIDDSVNIILQPGKHTIRVDSGFEGDWCGLIPMGRPCKCITTTGLKWNLDCGTLDFESIISTSNALDGSKVVTIDASDPVLWTMGIKPNV